MSLKHDIELIRSQLDYGPGSNGADEALSRIEAALALDDGPPREGDIVSCLDTCGYPYVYIWRKGKTKPTNTALIMRAEEVARRIEEVGK